MDNTALIWLQDNKSKKLDDFLKKNSTYGQITKLLPLYLSNEFPLLGDKLKNNIVLSYESLKVEGEK